MVSALRPLTPDFMMDFKAKNDAAITKAKTDLEWRIVSELEAMKKDEVGGEETQGKEVEPCAAASPTETAAS